MAMRICVIDDSPIDRAITMIALSELTDATIHEYPGGREALAAFERENADLIILNWHMPAFDGAAFIKNYRSSQTPAKAGRRGGSSGGRIIVLAHEARRHEMGEALRLGANHYALKPITPRALLRSVHQVMSR